jgi:hypothetical protein
MTMRSFLFWAFVLLALPGCGDQLSVGDDDTADGSTNLVKGDFPRAGVVFCDIEKSRHCATAQDVQRGIRLSEAAAALATGESSDIGIDDSPAALSRCGGQPEAVVFQGPFPNGLPICVNGAQVLGAGNKYPDANALCRDACADLFTQVGTSTPVVPPTASTIAFCAGVARASTNTPLDRWFDNGCLAGGTFQTTFADPRVLPEPVIWASLINVTAGGANGNDLTRNGASNTAFDAGAVSQQLVTRGDGWVEFSARDVTHAHFIGFTGVSAPPPNDTDPTFNAIDFAVLLRLDGRVYVYEKGAQLKGPDLNESFGTWTPSDRFRVHLVDGLDGTAKVLYERIVASCGAGLSCAAVPFHTSAAAARYPLRVDTAMRHEGATLTDVDLVRIK